MMNLGRNFPFFLHPGSNEFTVSKIGAVLFDFNHYHLNPNIVNNKETKYRWVPHIDYGASWSFFTRFQANFFIQFGFRKQLIRLHTKKKLVRIRPLFSIFSRKTNNLTISVTSEKIKKKQSDGLIFYFIIHEIFVLSLSYHRR